MEPVRDHVTAAKGPQSPRSARDWLLAQRVLFVLRSRPGGGGGHSVVQETAAMRRLGVDAQVAVRKEHLNLYRSAYTDIPDADTLFVPYEPSDLVVTGARFDVVVATSYATVRPVAELVEACSWVLPAYYAQDYEPWFEPEGSEAWHEAYASYTRLPGAMIFAKTHWLCRQIWDNHGVRVRKVEPSLDHDVYHPRPRAVRRPGMPVRVTAMVRPRTPRRGAGRTMELLARLRERRGDGVMITIFGCATDDPALLALPRSFPHENRGLLVRREVAALLQETDLFVDLSDYQAFGRTAIEAMACGAAVLVPALGGADEFARDGVNALVADTQDVAACLLRIETVLDEPNRMEAVQLAALSTAARYSTGAAALSELVVLAPALARLRAEVARPQRPQVVLLPSGPGQARLLPYRRAALAPTLDVRVVEDVPTPGMADVAVIERDLPGVPSGFLEAWLHSFRAAGGRIIHDLDEDLLDKAALAARGVPDPEKVARRVRAGLAVADLVTVPTPDLAAVLTARLPKLAGRLRVLPDRLDERLWNLDGTPVPDRRSIRPKEPGQIRIGIWATPGELADVKLVRKAMRGLEERYGAVLDVEVIGAFEGVRAPFGTRRSIPKAMTYPELARWVQLVCDWDIAIRPLADTPFNRSRGMRLLLESMALATSSGAPLVASDMPLARAVIRPNETGLLVVNGTEAWIEAITRLIEDAGLRQRLARTALHELAKRWALGTDPVPWRDTITTALQANFQDRP